MKYLPLIWKSLLRKKTRSLCGTEAFVLRFNTEIAGLGFWIPCSNDRIHALT